MRRIAIALLLALLRSEVATRALKVTVNEEQPDVGKHSLPSGDHP